MFVVVEGHQTHQHGQFEVLARDFPIAPMKDLDALRLEDGLTERKIRAIFDLPEQRSNLAVNVSGEHVERAADCKGGWLTNRVSRLIGSVIHLVLDDADQPGRGYV